MRLIFYFIVILSLSNCNHKAKEQDNSSVILAYINSTIIQEKYDTRIYNPPSPPESEDSINNKRSLKQDSIINNLEPLQIFISDSIMFNKTLTYKNIVSKKNFLYLKNVKKPYHSVSLDLNTLKERKGIILESINEDRFFELYPNIRFEDTYGGFISFQNLFISENGKNAYFEVNYFKSKLNTASYVVFAEFQYGAWSFKSEIISIS